MKKIFVLLIMITASNFFAQTAKEFVNDVPTIEVLSKFGPSNMYMRRLNETDFNVAIFCEFKNGGAQKSAIVINGKK